MARKKPQSFTLQEMKDEITRLILQGADPNAEMFVIGNGHASRIFADTFTHGRLYIHKSDERNCDRFAKGVDAVRAFADEIGEKLDGPEDVFLNFRNFMDWLYKKPSRRRTRKGAK